MPEGQRELTVSRIALLELKDEQRLVQEGYALLDEKRILLAAEIQRQLRRHAVLMSRCALLEGAARAASMSAVDRHGMEELSVYPPLSLDADRLSVGRSRLLALELLVAELTMAQQPATPREAPVNPTPEARSCAAAHLAWLVQAAELAGCRVNLYRLVREYVRTERRAKAIENVLMPEIVSGLKYIDEQLEGMDQEEVARLRLRIRA